MAEAQDNKDVQNIGRLSEVIGAINDEYTKLTDNKKADDVIKNMEEFKKFLDPLQQLMDVIKTMSFPDVDLDTFDIRMVMSDIGRVVRAAIRAANGVDTKEVQQMQVSLTQSFNAINVVLEEFNKLQEANTKNLDAILDFIIDIQILVKFAKELTDKSLKLLGNRIEAAVRTVIDAINEIDKISINDDLGKKVQTVEIVIGSIGKIFNDLKSIEGKNAGKIHLSGLKRNIEKILEFIDYVKDIKYDPKVTNNLAKVCKDIEAIFKVMAYLGLLSGLIITFFPWIWLALKGIKLLTPTFTSIVNDLGNLPDTTNARKAISNIAWVLIGFILLFWLAVIVAGLSLLFIPLYSLFRAGISAFVEIATIIDGIPMPKDTSFLSILKLIVIVRAISKIMSYMVRHFPTYMVFLIMSPIMTGAFRVFGFIMEAVSKMIETFNGVDGKLKFILAAQIVLASVIHLMRYLRKHIRTFNSLWTNAVVYDKAFWVMCTIMNRAVGIVNKFGEMKGMLKFIIFAKLPFKRVVDIMQYLNKHAVDILTFNAFAKTFVKAFIEMWIIAKLVYSMDFKKTGIFTTRKRVLKPYKLIIAIMRYLMRHSRTIKKFARNAAIYVPAFIMVAWLSQLAAVAILTAVTCLILITPVMALFVLLSPIIIIAVWLFVKVFKIIIKILVKLASPKVIVGLLLLIAVCGLIVILALEFVMIALIAAIVMTQIQPLLEFFLFLLVFGAILAILGLLIQYLVSFLTPMILFFLALAIMVALVWTIGLILQMIGNMELDIDKIKEAVVGIFEAIGEMLWASFMTFIKYIWFIPLALVGLALTSIVVLLLVFIAGLLWLLQIMKLDKEKIIKNVDAILDTCRYIIEHIFGGEDEDGKSSNKKGFLGFLKMIFGAMGDILTMIFGIAYLALMLIAIALIFFIAGLLWLLQWIKLDEDKIIANVDKVLRICQHIITNIFDPVDKEGKKSKHEGFTGFLKYILGGLGDVLVAVFAVAYLALMVIAIALILLLVGLLKIIELCSIDDDKIIQNVNKVIGTCQHIINTIFEPVDDNAKESKQTGFMGIIKRVFEGIGDVLLAVFAVVYLALMVIAIALVLLLIGLLKLIEITKVDYNEVRKKVNETVMTCQSIIEMLFGDYDDNTPGSKRDGFGGFLKKIFTSIADVILIVFAIVYVALMVIAIALILCLIGLLKLIEMANFNPDIVQDRVKSAISTCQMIIEMIFDPKDKDTESSNRGIFSDLLALILPEQMVVIIEAIFTVAYLAIMIIAMALILLIVKILEQIAATDPAIMEQAKQIAIGAVETCQAIIDLIFKGDDADTTESNRGIFAVFMEKLFRPVYVIFQALLSIAYLALMIIALKIVQYLCQILNEIGSLSSAKFKKGVQLAKDAVSSANEIIGLVFAKDNNKEKKKKGFLRKILEWVLGKDLMELIDALLAVGKLATMVMAVQAIGKLAELLSTVAKFKFNASEVKAGAQRVIGGANALIDYVLNGAGKVNKKEAKKVNAYFESFGNVADQFAWLCRKFENAATWYKPTPKYIDQIHEVITYLDNKFKDYKPKPTQEIKDIEIALQRWKWAVKACNDAMDQFDRVTARKDPMEGPNTLKQILTELDVLKVDKKRVEEKIYLIERLRDALRGVNNVTATDVKHSKEITTAYIKFLDKVQSLDMKRLEISDRMFANWAAITHRINGDFQGLAQALNGHIMPMLEKLNTTVDEVNKCQVEIMKQLSDGGNTPGAENAAQPNYLKTDSGKYLVNDQGEYADASKYSSVEDAKAAGFKETDKAPEPTTPANADDQTTKDANPTKSTVTTPQGGTGVRN